MSMHIKEFFARVFAMSTKHDHYTDFGYPETVTFKMLHRMYERNDLASAAVRKTTEKTFQNIPSVTNSADEEIKDLADALSRLGFWDKLSDVDEWSQVSGYAGLIFRIRDDKDLSEEPEAFALEDIVEIIPAWSEQLQVTEWHTDSSDEDLYGKPKKFMFNESAVGDKENGSPRRVVVHPDRVLIWSSDGTVKARSSLLSGFNNLLDMEKISGAGGEGFWKTAAAKLNIQIDKDADYAGFADEIRKETGKSLTDAFKEKTKKLNEGLDNNLITQGMKVENFSVQLPQPREFFEIPLMSYSAGRSIPMKILVGSQSGERASTEDANEWNQTIESRRNRWVKPGIRTFLTWLEEHGALQSDWELDWERLTNDTPDSKLSRSKTMTEINASTQTDIEDDPVFTSDEIRVQAGFESREEDTDD